MSNARASCVGQPSARRSKRAASHPEDPGNIRQPEKLLPFSSPFSTRLHEELLIADRATDFRAPKSSRRVRSKAGRCWFGELPLPCSSALALPSLPRLVNGPQGFRFVSLFIATCRRIGLAPFGSRNLVFVVGTLSRLRSWRSGMGNCWGTKIKAESPYHSAFASGVNSKPGSREGNTFSSSSSRLSVPPTPRSEDEILQSSNVKNFSFNELKIATRNFRPDSVLGEGGFGSVFKGWIDEKTYAPTKPGTGIVIAVKKLNHEGCQGHREWLTEVNYLGQLTHPNLVKLIGYCLEDEQRLLVYEFMQCGSLENHLFRRSSNFQPLSWNIRMKIALGAAKGLAFLHSEKAKVIYRDFKASNVLLDSNYNAKLSDFGLAKDGPTGDNTHVSTRVMGTHGYAAPEYLATGHLTPKSDVYSFGVVLLEMLSGCRSLDRNRPIGQHHLVEWARPLLASKRKFFRVLDSRLGGQYPLQAAQNAALLALWCLSGEAKNRPTMDQVVSTLEEIQNVKGSGRAVGSEHKSSSHSMIRNNRERPRPRSMEVPGNRKATYPRPSASPLYT